MEWKFVAQNNGIVLFAETLTPIQQSIIFTVNIPVVNEIPDKSNLSIKSPIYEELVFECYVFIDNL